jgi:hypothetical protein
MKVNSKNMYHSLILTKKGEKDSEFNIVVENFLQRLRDFNLITEEEYKTYKDKLDDCIVSFKDDKQNIFLTKYLFPSHLIGIYPPKDIVLKYNTVKKAFQRELIKHNRMDYSLYNRVNYFLQPNELKKLDKVIKNYPYFRDVPKDDLFITLRIESESNNFHNILNIAKDIEDYINSAKIQQSPTKLDELKDTYNSLRLKQIKEIAENNEFKSLLTKQFQDISPGEYDTKSTEGLFNTCLKMGIFIYDYTKTVYGIPINNLLRGSNDLFSDLDYIRFKYNNKESWCKLNFNICLTNECEFTSLWKCGLEISSEYKKFIDRVLHKGD